MAVYEGGLPTGGFDDEMKGSGFGVSNEGEFNYVPNQSEAKRPQTVNQGGSGAGKTYDQKASQDFLLDSSYKTDLEVGRPGKMDVDNPDDLSHSDRMDDSDFSSK